MSRTPLLVATVAGATLAATAILVLRSGPVAMPGKGEGGGLAALFSTAGRAHQVPAAPAEEPGALAPQVSAEEAAAIARDFFARPAPPDAELAARAPVTGAKNVPVSECAAYWPKAADEALSLGPAGPERRMKAEIYDRLNVLHTLSSGNCTCAGKITAFEPVGLILDTLKQKQVVFDGRLFTPYRQETRRLMRAVERLCGGVY